MSNGNSGRTVRFTLDPANPPKLSDLAKARLSHLAAMPDSEIDFSDIPRIPANAEWTRPGIPRLTGNEHRPKK